MKGFLGWFREVDGRRASWALRGGVFVFFLALTTWRTRDQSGATLNLNGIEVDVPKTLVGSRGSHDHQRRANPFRRLKPAIHIRGAKSREWRVSLVDSENHWAGMSHYPLDGLLRNLNAGSEVFREAYDLGPLPSVERMTIGGLKGYGAWVIQPRREILIAEVAGKRSQLYMLFAVLPPPGRDPELRAAFDRCLASLRKSR